MCCGSGMFFLDPGSELFLSGIRIFSIADPGSASKSLGVLAKVDVFGLTIYDQDPGSRHRIRIRNTAFPDSFLHPKLFTWHDPDSVHLIIIL